MGLFNKFKRKKEASHQSSPALSPAANTALTVFFQRHNIETEEIKAAICETFGDDAVLSVDEKQSVTHLMLNIDGTDIICSYLPFPMPEDETDIAYLFKFNHYITEEEQRALVEHRSFCLLTEIGGGSTLEGKRSVCLLLTRLCKSLLKIEDAAGVYYSAANLLLGKEMYLKYASIAQQQEDDPSYFPSTLWILVYQTHTEDGVNTVETCGLEQFGFCELQFYDPKEEWAYSFEKLYIMSTFEITEMEVYKDMDTICFTQDSMSIFKQNGKKLAVIGGI